MSAPGMRPAWQLPVQWPAAGARIAQRRALEHERLLKGAIVAALLAILVLDRFALRLGDAYAAHPAFIALYGLLAVMLLSGTAQLDARGSVRYAVAIGVGALSYLVNDSIGASQHVSITSWLLLLALYLPFAVSLREGAAPASLSRWAIDAYVGLALVVAAAGVAQFCVQFVYNPPWLFDYTAYIPEPIRAFEVWNRVYTVGDWTKANGFFLREPSFFSVHMATALLCELSLARRKAVLALLATGLLLSYSGSGLLVLAIGLAFPLGRHSLLRFAGAGALAALVFFVFGDTLNLSYTLGRVTEVSSNTTSAYCRFVDPVVLTLRDIDANPWSSLLGHGPGTLYKMYGTCETTFAKVPFEYGLLGALAFGLLVFHALDRPGVPSRIRAALGGQWLTQAHLFSPEWVLLAFVLCAMWPRTRD